MRVFAGKVCRDACTAALLAGSCLWLGACTDWHSIRRYAASSELTAQEAGFVAGDIQPACQRTRAFELVPATATYTSANHGVDLFESQCAPEQAKMAAMQHAADVLAAYERALRNMVFRRHVTYEPADAPGDACKDIPPKDELNDLDQAACRLDALLRGAAKDDDGRSGAVRLILYGGQDVKILCEQMQVLLGDYIAALDDEDVRRKTALVYLHQNSYDHHVLQWSDMLQGEIVQAEEARRREQAARELLVSLARLETAADTLEANADHLRGDRITRAIDALADQVDSVRPGIAAAFSD